MSKAIDTGNNTDNGVNRTWTIRKDGEVLRRTVFDSQNQPLDYQICGENPQRIVREYDDEGRLEIIKYILIVTIVRNCCSIKVLNMMVEEIS